jgi:FMN-dependent NADH-azoreductase
MCYRSVTATDARVNRRGAPEPIRERIMTNILFISSSPRGSASYSNRVAANVLENLRRVHPDATVTVHDLSRDPPPHIDADFAAGLVASAEKRTEHQRVAIARSDEFVEELLRADIVVIAVAMINFSIPSTLKAWLDHVARSGRTFSYSEGRPKGLVIGKQIILVQAKGGVYSGATSSFDFVTPYLKHMLGFLGMSEVQVIDVEGTSLGVASAEQALARGIQCADAVVQQVTTA